MDNVDKFDSLFAAAECEDAKIDESLIRRKSFKKVIRLIILIF